MRVSPEIRAELEKNAIEATEALDVERGKLEALRGKDFGKFMAQQVRVTAAAQAHERAMMALFSSEESTSRSR